MGAADAESRPMTHENTFPAIDVDSATPLLGGLSPAQFMRRHWHKKPLLIRQAFPGAKPPLSRAALFALAGSQDVESRLIEQQALRRGAQWSLRHGPFARRALPPLERRGWTLLVQGLDLHVQAAHEMLERFAFVPRARLDDLMISYASDGGGVGPHFDSYDVFLIQVHGRRRWRVGRLRDPQLRDDVPLKILSNFVAEQEWVLEPGDMLYLPPRWAHDGIAEGECMTCSVGFRAAGRRELARDLLQRLLDVDEDEEVGADRLYGDPGQTAVSHPGAIPPALSGFAEASLHHWLRQAASSPQVQVALGEALTEPKPGVWFDGEAGAMDAGVALDRRTRMMYDERHVYINGESWRAAGADARLLRQLADRRMLGVQALRGASPAARGLLEDWLDHGWLRPVAG
jgi:50S ribosomal protein L16 3-hydroxylase